MVDGLMQRNFVTEHLFSNGYDNNVCASDITAVSYSLLLTPPFNDKATVVILNNFAQKQNNKTRYNSFKREIIIIIAAYPRMLTA
jgi:hypothetical protein